MLMSDLFFSSSEVAIVSDAIHPHQRGRIYYQNTYWFAYAENDIRIPVNMPVEVLRFKNNTWLVKPIALSDDMESLKEMAETRMADAIAPFVT